MSTSHATAATTGNLSRKPIMALTPRHQSTLKRSRSMRPRGLDCASLPDETRVFIEHEVLDIYSRMVNAGCSLQQTLTAVFLSGMSAASAAMPNAKSQATDAALSRQVACTDAVSYTHLSANATPTPV